MTTHEEAKKVTSEKAVDAKQFGQENVGSIKPENDSLELSEAELETVAGAGNREPDDSN